MDPGAGGLQVTSDGKPKIIERIDASGAGDIDMSKQAEVTDDLKLVGITGKSLIVPQSWCDANVDKNKFRIGSKRIFAIWLDS